VEQRKGRGATPRPFLFLSSFTRVRGGGPFAYGGAAVRCYKVGPELRGIIFLSTTLQRLRRPAA
jgi:hypothetical protein